MGAEMPRIRSFLWSTPEKMRRPATCYLRPQQAGRRNDGLTFIKVACFRGPL